MIRMNIFKMKNLAIMILLLVLTVSLCACGAGATNDIAHEQGASASPAATATASPEASPSEEEHAVQYPLNFTDSFEREVILEKEPQRIVSIAPSATEMVCALGMQDKLVGRTDYCDYPESVKSIQSIGSLMAPNIEAIAELKPDIVIAAAHFKKEVLEQLEKLKIKVVVVYGPESFEGIYDTIVKIGMVVNAVPQAEALVEEMSKEVDEITTLVKDLEKPSVYYVLGFSESGDYTAGKGTFIGQMIEMAGAKNTADDVEGWQYSLEKLVEKNPDMLICPKEDEYKDQLKTANGYKKLDAVINDKVYLVEKNLLQIPGPRSAKGLRALAEIIHPDVVK